MTDESIEMRLQKQIIMTILTDYCRFRESDALKIEGELYSLLKLTGFPVLERTDNSCDFLIWDKNKGILYFERWVVH